MAMKRTRSVVIGETLRRGDGFFQSAAMHSAAGAFTCREAAIAKTGMAIARVSDQGGNPSLLQSLDDPDFSL